MLKTNRESKKPKSTKTNIIEKPLVRLIKKTEKALTNKNEKRTSI